MKYTVCPVCGAHLDFGETCDCKGNASRDDSDEKGGGRHGGGTVVGGGAVSWHSDRTVGAG